MRLFIYFQSNGGVHCGEHERLLVRLIKPAVLHNRSETVRARLHLIEANCFTIGRLFQVEHTIYVHPGVYVVAERLMRRGQLTVNGMKCLDEKRFQILFHVFFERVYVGEIEPRSDQKVVELVFARIQTEDDKAVAVKLRVDRLGSKFFVHTYVREIFERFFQQSVCAVQVIVVLI